MIRKKLILLLAVNLGLCGYFTYHAVNGRHGLEARMGVEARVKSLEAELKLIKAEREGLERRAAAMTDGPAGDRDLIEEQARVILNFSHPADIIMLDTKRNAP
ncbi:MAG: septum formation initiator family protein [Hyphomicrobiales bacterium]|nr:septum formation initiator family protein [Hyphomicrobiales bacterium]